MIAGQRPKPANLKLLAGNPGKRALNRDEPVSPPLRAMPRDLDPRLHDAWRKITRLAPPGVLREADELLVELAARLLVQSRVPEVPVGVAVQLRQCLAELGMSPSARARLSVPPPPVENPFDAI